MAIKTPTVPGRPAPGAAPVPADPEIPVEIPRHGGDGRPKIRRLDDPTAFDYYARASSFGKVIADTYNLDRWDKRVITWGLSRDRSLVLAAQAVPAWEDPANPELHKRYRDELNDIVDRAREVGRSDRAAMRGTALHTLSEQADAGADLSHLDPTTAKALQVWRRMMGMFRIVATETFVVHDDLQVGGSFDRLAELLVDITVRDGDGKVLALLPAGTRVIVDLKSGRSSDHYGVEYATQLHIYAGGTPYVHVDDDQAAAGDNGRRPWPDGGAPHQGWALIPHVPVDNPDEAGLLWVDLSVGRACAELVAQVKEARKAAKGAFYAGEIVEPGEQLGPADLAAQHGELLEVLIELIGAAPDEAAIDALYERHAADWCEELTEAARARVEALAAQASPAPLTQVQLVAAIRATTTEEQLDELYRAHADQWTGYVGKVAAAHVEKLDAAAASMVGASV